MSRYRRTATWRNRLRITPWLFRTAFVAVTTLACAALPVQSQSRADEYRVKAAFILHFAELAEWPLETTNASDSAFKICVMGNDPFHGALEESMEGKSMGAKPIRVHHPREFRDVLACHVLFVAETESRRVSALLDEAKDAPVLTIGDSEDFVLQNGGMIGFCLENNKVRFDVNVVAANRAHIKISSRLLLLAKVVVGNQVIK